MIRLLVALVALAVAVPAAAQPLSLDEVLRSSATHAPAILEAITRERQADGRRLSAEGAFDLLFEGDAQSRLLGYYDGTIVEGRATRPLTTNGGYLYGGYRVSRGDFPIYEDKAFTNRLGEVKVGAVFALMRDRLIDERRARLGLTSGDIAIARLDREMVAIGVQRRAIEAYQNWVAAGMRVGVYRDLLTLAAERQQSIERLIALGARPQILGVENRQNIVRRQTLLVRAEQELASAANALSFFLRGADGEPVQPPASRLPAGFPALRLPALGPDLARRIERPDLEAILVRLDQVEVRRLLAENDLRPRLDVRAEAAKDIGPIGLGGVSRDPAEGIVGLRFSLPLERRQARGRIVEAAAEADGLRLRRKLVEDQILVEVNGLAIQASAADRLVALAADETALADRMAAAERRRFELGASDFIVVNLREESAADARLRQLDAEFRRSAARAELVAATVDREQLGL
ncbi:TolC family protein [Sphingomonas baiyangensis]|uniref:TolC family protein n=1 Tax=Sphingomonas baiyangensis TaxID=2572576 RepID=A0A4U1L4D1_9SPHN|nr:TolC family protein [Sphingomonas baiyangensis]TKD51622.1 TolC family protein [Sphingomonas baiyangensis]